MQDIQIRAPELLGVSAAEPGSAAYLRARHLMTTRLVRLHGFGPDE
jgi:hypothetical protein